MRQQNLAVWQKEAEGQMPSSEMRGGRTCLLNPLPSGARMQTAFAGETVISQDSPRSAGCQHVFLLTDSKQSILAVRSLDNAAPAPDEVPPPTNRRLHSER